MVIISLSSASLAVSILAVFCQLYLLASGRTSYTYIEDNHPRELPLPEPLRTVNMRFSDDPMHYPISGVQGWAEWNAIHPPGGGYVFLGKSYFPFGVTMWHQLHCLNHIRAIFANGDDGSQYTDHCFHYLRLGILCTTDTTLEKVDVKLEERKRPPGEGVTHSCRDWKAVYDWTSAEHAKWTPEMEARLLDRPESTRVPNN